jgi:hypothetical protein
MEESMDGDAEEVDLSTFHQASPPPPGTDADPEETQGLLDDDEVERQPISRRGLPRPQSPRVVRNTDEERRGQCQAAVPGEDATDKAAPN